MYLFVSKDCMEITIIGAGSSGLIAARGLARLGISVKVLERKSAIKPIYSSSGILSHSGLESLKINYKKCVLNKLYGAKIHFPGVTLHIRSTKVQAYVVDRTKLANELYEEAVASGANVEFSHSVTKGEMGKLNGILVGADGAASQVASYFKFPPIKRFVLTYRAEYKARENIGDEVEIFFDNNVTKGFFGWIAPHGDNIELGAGIDEKYGKSTDAFRKFVASSSVRKMIEGKPIVEGAGIIPVSLRKRFVDEERRVVLVGDAAGQVKSSTGGGIIFGGNASLVAARAISNYIQGDGRLEDYQRAWLSTFGNDIRMHNLIRNIYSSLSNSGLYLFAKTAKSLGIERFLSRYGDMDRPSLILKRLIFRKA